MQDGESDPRRQNNKAEQKVASALDPTMKIKKNYVRNVTSGLNSSDPKKASAAGTQKCPNCKAEILKSEWKSHFKICVMDGKWKE